ncbi:MAG: biosynthetic-type acetolactate synthase large subunit [Clostridiales bacterium]|nr:biosynthetic-type acetolactate synthase large subunit [Candidatus Crickella merdequi]
MKLKGSDILMECLLEQGVDTIFGYPGGTVINLYDSIYKYGDKIKHILTAHEQGASHAADGYARSTGKVGVCIATSGPGATNLTTGIATAFMDSSPVVFITCNVGEAFIGKDSFQECDTVGITMPITKCNYLVKDVNEIASTVRAAFAMARSGRPGPVVIDILTNISGQEAEYEKVDLDKHYESGKLATLKNRPTHNLKPHEPEGDIDKLIEMIEASEKPMVICGGGVVRGRAQAEFLEFVEKADAPVAITIMGAGGFDGSNPLSTNMIGMHGSQASNRGIDACDLLISVGCRFNERVTLDVKHFARNAKIVHIDIDRSEIDKNVKTDHHIVGDAKRVLEIANKKLKQQDHTPWKEYVFQFPKEQEYESGGDTLTPKQITEAIAKILPEKTIVATDVGQHQMWAIQHLHFTYPGQLITSGGFGAMGFGLGAAIGAKVGNPDQCVCHITGDGSFRMNFAELCTEQKYDIPVITVLFNNSALGMVRQWQTLMYDHRYSQTYMDRGPDFVKLAEAFGIMGMRCTTKIELEAALQAALESGKSAVIECPIDIDELVRPMVPGGRAITNFIVD